MLNFITVVYNINVVLVIVIVILVFKALSVVKIYKSIVLKGNKG